MSVRFSTVRSGDVIAYTREDFDPLLPWLSGALAQAIELDRAEVEYAKSKMKGFLFFWDGYDAEGTQSRFAELERGACAAMGDALGKEYTKNLPYPFGGTSRLDGLLKTVYFVGPNMNGPHKQWGAHADRLHDIGVRAQGITIDSWQGEAAESYRRKAVERANDAFFMEDLARHNQWAIEATSFLQTMIAEKIKASLEAVKEKLKREREYELDVRTGGIDEAVTRSGDAGAIGFDFYKRTVAVWDAVVGLPDVWLALLNEDLDWQSSARRVRDVLKEAVVAMEQRHANAGYADGLGLIDKDNGVDDQERHAGVSADDQHMKDSLF